MAQCPGPTTGIIMMVAMIGDLICILGCICLQEFKIKFRKGKETVKKLLCLVTIASRSMMPQVNAATPIPILEFIAGQTSTVQVDLCDIAYSMAKETSYPNCPNW